MQCRSPLPSSSLLSLPRPPPSRPIRYNNTNKRRIHPPPLTCPVRGLEPVPGAVDAVGGVAWRRRRRLRVRERGHERVERRGEEHGRGDARADDVEAGDGHCW